MARKVKPKEKPKRGRKPDPNSKRALGIDRHKHPRKAFHAPAPVFDALARFQDATQPRPTDTAVIVTALAEYLSKRGFTP